MKNLVSLSFVAFVVCLTPQNMFAETPQQMKDRIENASFSRNSGSQQPVIMVPLTAKQMQANAAEAERKAKLAEQERIRALREETQKKNATQDKKIPNRWDEVTTATIRDYLKHARTELQGLKPLDDGYFAVVILQTTAITKNGQQVEDLSLFASQIATYWQERSEEYNSKQVKDKLKSYAAFSKKVEQKILQQANKSDVVRSKSENAKIVLPNDGSRYSPSCGFSIISPFPTFHRSNTAMPNYFYHDASSVRQGPIDDQQLQVLVARRVIVPTTPLETDTGHKGLAGQIPNLFDAVPPISESPFVAPMPTSMSASPTPATQRDRQTFVALAILLGGLGIHNFYARRKFSEITNILPAVRFPQGLADLPLGLLNIAITFVVGVCYFLVIDNSERASRFASMNYNAIDAGRPVLRAAEEDFYSGCAGLFSFLAFIILIAHLAWIIRDAIYCKTDGDGVPMK
ncbi:MAG: hypothetical protein ACRC46_15145 [Thermoguttaceae bacterium]